MLLSITINPWFVCILVDVTTFGLFRFGDGVVGGGVIGGVKGLEQKQETGQM